MKTKAEKIILSVENSGSEFIGMSDVWNVYGGISLNKNSSLYKDAINAFNKNKGIKIISVYIGVIGRSQHSKTDLIMFDSSKDLEIYDYDYIIKRADVMGYL